MNSLLTILLYIIVLLHVTFVSIKTNPSNSDDEEVPLIGRKQSDQKNSVRKKSTDKDSLLFYKGKRRNSHNKVSARKPSLNNRNCISNIRLYLRGKIILNSIYNTVWYNFDYKHYWKNNYVEYKSKVVEQINLIRLVHGVCPLQESTRLDRLAQEEANEIAAKGYSLSKRLRKYGVIKAAFYISELTGLVSRWYNEKIFYNYHVNYGLMASKFTQIVWKDSVHIGVGVSKKRNVLHLVVVFYPKGNIFGQYKRNVLKKKISWKKMIYAE
uniref:CAP domain-containing protein (inferred by orthology to a zebrafish protein) n=1 Tax=Strongyloides venezuelensis TaxID=75913 RepID=A0A0K0F285_STRVS